MTTKDQILIDALMQGGQFGHAVEKLRLLETHISWVILCGEFAYKIKKPLKLDFLDFSTLALRKRACEDELRLNQRWAPSLYLDVVAITGSESSPVVGGNGEPVEYAVKMRQFPQSMRLDAQLVAGLVTGKDMQELASTIARAHANAPAAPAMPAERALAAVETPMLDNFHHLQEVIEDPARDRLLQWTRARLCEARSVLLARQHEGFIRECHGDLHLANLVRLEGGIRAFDCIEFSADLRHIDVISDVAFLVMDLAARGREDLAFRFINEYLELTGDYAGMAVFGLYYVYHCLIRAKVAAIRSRERAGSPAAIEDDAEAKRYGEVAMRWVAQRQVCLVAMHGFSGSGKTWLSGQLMSALPAIRLRSDVERQRLYGRPDGETPHQAVAEGRYSAKSRSAVYQRLFELGAVLAESGLNVILDAAFLDAGDRERARELARKLGVRFVIVTARAGAAELERRVRARQGDASEADNEVLRWQRHKADALTAQELETQVCVATDQPIDLRQIVARILHSP